MPQIDASRLAVLETKIGILTKSVEDGFSAMNQKVDIGLDSVNKKVESFIAGADNKYAPKWIGTAFMAGCGVVLVGVLGIALIEPLKGHNSPQQSVTVTTQNPNGTTTTRVIPLTGSGQIIQANPDNTDPQSGSSTGGSTTNDTPTDTTPDNNQPSGICTVPVVGALCN